MFKNPEKKMKAAAVILFWVMIAGSVAMAFVYGFVKGWFHAEIFVPILVGGCIFSYVVNLALYGFGELIERHGKTEENNDDLPEL